MVTETAQTFHTLAQAQNKDLNIAVEPMLSMDADEKAISKLVGILLDNALKYSPEGTPISLGLEKQGKQIKLSVENKSAVPLPEGNLDRLFERFYRADPSRNSQTGGHGIGLSIARAIVSAHNGQIHAFQPSPGSLRITVSLPRMHKPAVLSGREQGSGECRIVYAWHPASHARDPVEYAQGKGKPIDLSQINN